MKGDFPLPKLTVLITTPDVERLAAFYTDQLGFSRIPGTPPDFAALSRGAAEIALTHGEAGGSAITLSLLVEDLDAWRSAVTSDALVHDIKKGMMGLPTFAVTDPDGNRITLSSQKKRKREAPFEPGIHLLASRSVRVSPDEKELADGVLRITDDRLAALQIDPTQTPPLIKAGGASFTATTTHPPMAEESMWLSVGELYGALSMQPGDDLLITLRSGSWNVRRVPADQRNEDAIREANHIAVRSALLHILAQAGPVALRTLTDVVHQERGWGGTPPDELFRIIKTDDRLVLTPLLTVVPGPGSATGEHGDAVKAWNRQRLRAGVASLKATPGKDLEAALGILGLTAESAEAMRATRRLARGETRTEAEDLTRQVLEALMKEPGE